MRAPALSNPIAQNWQGFLDCIQRKGTPDRVHFFEIYLDPEIQQAICEQFGLMAGVGPDDPYLVEKRNLEVQRFLGYDYVMSRMDGLNFAPERQRTRDTAALQRTDGRAFTNEHEGAITTWEQFERFPWPDAEKASTRSLEWYSQNLPDDMCIMGAAPFVHLPELMGLETFCFALHEQRDLVLAIRQRLMEIYRVATKQMMSFDRVKLVLGMDDMGFRTGTLVSPKDCREFFLPGHKTVAEISHAAGRPYVLHSCGKLDAIMEDLIENVGIDAKHSFEDTIQRVVDAKALYGDRIAVLGGMDMNFMCRADETRIRQRVRDTLQACMQGGGYCLGTGNTVANYIPLDNYLAMIDEGRRFRL